MTQELGTHIAGIALHLSLLADPSDTPGSSEGQYIGKVVSASAVFALNSIPSMTVAVPHGSQINNGTLTPSYAYSAILKDTIEKRQPVGVYLDYIGEEQVDGLPPVNSCTCLIKGYILEQSVQNDLNGGASQFTIVHWLSDMTNIAMVNRLSSPDNPADISSDAAFSQYDPSGEKMNSAWVPVTAYSKAITEGKNIYDALKLGLKSTMDEGQKTNYEEAGSLGQEEYYKRSVKALEAIEGLYLDFNPSINVSRELALAISGELSREQRGSCLSVTLWQKLVQTFLPQYYLALIPAVDKAYVVPQPGIQISDDICYTIDDKCIVALRTHTKHGKALGAVFLASRTPTVATALVNTLTYSTKFQYPAPKDMTSGVLKACWLPAWLEMYKEVNACLADNRVEDFVAFLNPEAGTDTSDTNGDESKDDNFRTLCKLFVKTVFHAEVTRGNVATVQMPLFLWLVPGTPVKVHVPKDVLTDTDDEYIAGIIEKVQYIISTTSMTTTLTLSDLRVGNQIQNYALDNALLYKHAFYFKASTGITLYQVPGKELSDDGRIEEVEHK